MFGYLCFAFCLWAFAVGLYGAWLWWFVIMVAYGWGFGQLVLCGFWCLGVLAWQVLACCVLFMVTLLGCCLLMVQLLAAVAIVCFDLGFLFPFRLRVLTCGYWVLFG